MMMPQVTTPKSSRRRKADDDEAPGAITPPEAWVEEFEGYHGIDGSCNWMYIESNPDGTHAARRCEKDAVEI